MLALNKMFFDILNRILLNNIIRWFLFDVDVNGRVNTPNDTKAKKRFHQIIQDIVVYKML